MEIGRNWLGIDGQSHGYAQQELFPLDCWGAERSFAVIDWPHPAIARAMVGPLQLGDIGERRNHALKCLVVAADGEFAVSTSLFREQLGDASAMWAHAARELDLARGRPLGNECQRSVAPSDSLSTWSNPAFWFAAPVSGDPVHRSVLSLARLIEIRERPLGAKVTDEQRIRAEHDAQTAVTAQVAPAVLSVLESLSADLFAVISDRQHISISVIHRLMTLARQHGTSAVTYTWQALRTEALPLLHLAASGSPQKESQQVLEALFCGRSLPDSLAEIGVSKAAHRRSLRKPNHGTQVVPAANEAFSELMMSGVDWLTSMRSARKRPPNSVSDWSELCHLMTDISSLDLHDSATGHDLMRCCISAGYRQSRHRLQHILALARAIQKAATRLAHTELTFDQTLRHAMSTVDELHGFRDGGDINSELADLLRDTGHLAVLVSKISGESLVQLTGSLFETLPGIPSDLQLPADTTIEVLRSVDAIVHHGTACGNCLRFAELAIGCVAEGLALYGVSVKGQLEGTIALRGSGSFRCQKVLVHEATGLHNEELSPALSRLAESLADGWTSKEKLAEWHSYELACKRWKQSLA